MKVYAIQERIIHSHLRALDHLCAARGLTLDYHQFAVLRPVLAAFYKRDMPRLRTELARAMKLLCLLPRLLFGPRALVVLGIAPFDVRLALLAPLLLRHKVYLHNSWPNWGPEDPVPKARIFRLGPWLWNRFISRHVSGIFCVSETTAASIGQHFPGWPAMAIVGHTIDATWFADVKHIAAKPWRRSVAFVGRMVAEKGIAELLNLAHTLPEHQFHFIGDGPMEQAVRDSGLPNTVCHGYIGNRQQLIDILDGCDIVVQPSRHAGIWVEAFGLGVLEGMARGLVPVTTDSPGSLAVLGADLAFLTCPVAEYEAHFQRSIATLDAEQAKALRRHCASRAAHFAPPAVTKRWDDFLVQTRGLPGAPEAPVR